MAKADDDFVFTLSDNDEAGALQAHSSGEESQSSDGEPQRAQMRSNGNKRKRKGDSDGGEGTKKKNLRSKKRKLENSNRRFREGSDDSGDDYEAGEEDDGALNPDFDFEMPGLSNGGVVEDFDGWGNADSSLAEKEKQKQKQGVDLDEIIERRRARKLKDKEETVNGHAHVDSAQNDIDGLGSEQDLEEIGYADEDEPEGDGFPNFEDDELLAVDGFGAGAIDHADEEAEEDGDGEVDQNGELEDGSDTDEESVASPTAHPDDIARSDSESETSVENPEEAAKRVAFFASEVEEESTSKSGLDPTGSTSFQSFSLSRPILKGLSTLSFTTPTPIQQKTIPIALLGKDVVGSAVTGSGKTAAFLLPILERLLYRPRKIPTTRVAILMPTRELAVQCYAVAIKLATFTDITFAQLVGGFSLREQEAVLKKRPDVVIATPGRFIDHMRNTASFTISDTLEILVLDEADRMLEDGFADELNEIISSIPKSRQTMLFSATMTESVDKLIRVGLNRPVRLMIDKQKSTVGTLTQEFVRLRPGREDKRLGYLVHLCKNIHTQRTIIFFRQKKDAHRVRIVFSLLGLKAGELHGSMTQEQRISAVEGFRAGKTQFLLATDLASRGLDIKGVETVVNYEAPGTHEVYLHRVGRTARAGKVGRACTIAAESDRRVVKAAVKAARAQGAKIVSRVVEVADADSCATEVEGLEGEVDEVLREEKEERALQQVGREVTRAGNLVKHREEYMSRPRRTWFETEREKRGKKVKEGKARRDGDGGGGEGKKKNSVGGGKLSGKEKKRLDDRRERVDEGGKGPWRKGKGSEDAVTRERVERRRGKDKDRGKGKSSSGPRKGGAKAKGTAPKTKTKGKRR